MTGITSGVFIWLQEKPYVLWDISRSKGGSARTPTTGNLFSLGVYLVAGAFTADFVSVDAGF
jgi:hypothetical protein